MKSDVPSRFAQAMDKGEVAAFKASEHLNTGRWCKQRKLLFHAMLHLDTYDAVALEKAQTDSQYIRILATEKHRMLVAMMACALERHNYS